MKLYYSPGACSLAPHIVLAELGLKHEMIKVDLKAHKTEAGEDFYKINPKGYVPAVVDDQGKLHTEGVSILLFLASLKPEKKLAVLPGQDGYFDQLEWLTLVSSEFHKGIGATAFAGLDEAGSAVLRAKLEKRLQYLDQHLGKTQYLVGSDFNVADAYLYTVLNWLPSAKVDLAKYKNIAAYHARVEARPGVQKAREMEGLPASSLKKAA